MPKKEVELHLSVGDKTLFNSCLIIDDMRWVPLKTVLGVVLEYYMSYLGVILLQFSGHCVLFGP